jgi:hypothetical protein
VCKCGSTFEAPFRSLFHVHLECCPNCGADKSTFKIVKMQQDVPLPSEIEGPIILIFGCLPLLVVAGVFVWSLFQ